MFCPKCGEIVRDTALKCPNCRASLRGGSTKVNKNCDHRHAEPDTVESSRSWQNPSKWDNPQATVKIFGQTISREKVEAFQKSFNQAQAESYSQAFSQEQFSSKAEEIIVLMKRFFLGYRDFSGRTSRREFWLTTAIIFFGSLFLSLFFSALGILVSLVLLLPSIAMAVRRLHDTGKDGRALLVGLFPYFGFIVLLVWYCQPSTSSNQWGPAPRR